MSDLYIMLDEAYDAATMEERAKRLLDVCNRWKLNMAEVVQAYNDYTDSDMFYAERGM